MQPAQDRGAERVRTYEWQDPAPVRKALGRGLSGLQVLDAIGKGRLPEPPALRTLGIEPWTAAPGRVVFTLAVQEFHYNPLGIVHGGVLVALLDTAMGCAVHSHLPAGTGYVTVELSTTFLRPVTVASGVIVCTGTALPTTAGTTTSAARIEDERGRVVAAASSTCLIRALDERPPAGRVTA
jgi:uncharacterized protein (TIGR00369 family)